MDIKWIKYKKEGSDIICNENVLISDGFEVFVGFLDSDLEFRFIDGELVANSDFPVFYYMPLPEAPNEENLFDKKIKVIYERKGEWFTCSKSLLQENGFMQIDSLIKAKEINEEYAQEFKTALDAVIAINFKNPIFVTWKIEEILED